MFGGETDTFYDLVYLLGGSSFGVCIGYWVARLRSPASAKPIRVASTLKDKSGLGCLLMNANGGIEFANEPVRVRFGTDAITRGNNVFQVAAFEPVRGVLARCLDGDIPKPQILSIHGEEVILVFDAHLEDQVWVYVFDGTGFNTAQRVRTEFVANAAHELRTPLATILGYAETLQVEQKGLSADQILAMEAIYRNGCRLRDIFEDILRLARIEAGADLMIKQKSHVLSVMQETLASVADLADSRDVEFVLQCPPNLYFLMNAESTRTIVTNLAKNAVNYTHSGGQVTVTCHRVEEHLCVVVADNGIGIAPEYHERIFERFFRVDVGRSRSVGGTGLGLALVKHLCVAIGGKLTLTSEEGKGSTFTLYL